MSSKQQSSVLLREGLRILNFRDRWVRILYEDRSITELAPGEIIAESDVDGVKGLPPEHLDGYGLDLYIVSKPVFARLSGSRKDITAVGETNIPHMWFSDMPAPVT